MGMEKSLYDEMLVNKEEGVDMAFDAGADEMVFKPMGEFKPLVAPAPGGMMYFDDHPTAALQKRVAELEHNMEQMVAIVEELLNERERFETTYRVESREGPFTSDFKAA